MRLYLTGVKALIAIILLLAIGLLITVMVLKIMIMLLPVFILSLLLYYLYKFLKKRRKVGPEKEYIDTTFREKKEV